MPLRIACELFIWILSILKETNGSEQCQIQNIPLKLIK